MKQTLEYGAQEKYIEMIEERSSSILKNMYGKDTKKPIFKKNSVVKKKLEKVPLFFIYGIQHE